MPGADILIHRHGDHEPRLIAEAEIERGLDGRHVATQRLLAGLRTFQLCDYAAQPVRIDDALRGGGRTDGQRENQGASHSLYLSQ